MNKEKMLNLLGLATRARMVVLGEEFVLKGMKDQQVIVFLASDAGNNIKKKIRNKTTTYNAILVEEFSSNELSKAMGKENRRVVLIADKGFIKAFKKLISPKKEVIFHGKEERQEK